MIGIVRFNAALTPDQHIRCSYGARRITGGISGLQGRLFVRNGDIDAHQTRTRASAWWQATGHMPRSFTLAEE